MRALTDLKTILFVVLAGISVSAQNIETCRNSLSAEPRTRQTCVKDPFPAVSFRNAPSSQGQGKVYIVRPDRTVGEGKLVNPGETVTFLDICPGFQFYIEVAECGKCLRLYTVSDVLGPPESFFVPKDFCQDDTPNVIVAMADDIGSRDFGFLGGDVIRTPIIDKLARESLSFLSAWATPLCRTTRSIIMTGKLPYETRWFSHKEPPPDRFKPFGPGIGNLAKSAGYETLWVGKWQIFGNARGEGGYGFDNYTIWRHSDTESVAELIRQYDGPVPPVGVNDWGRYNHPVLARDDQAVDTDPLDFSSNIFLKDLQQFMVKNRNNNKKSFVYWPMTLAHKDWDFSKGEMGWVRMPVLNQMGEVVGYQPGKPSFEKMVEYLDTMMGLLIDGLKRDNLYNNTVIIFCTDNGSPTADQTTGFKSSTTDERGVRVPVLIHGGGGRIPARFTRDMFSLVDVYSTVAGFMNVGGRGRPNSLDFSNFALGKTNQGPRKWSFSFLKEDRMLRTRDWVYDAKKNLFNCANTTVIEECERIPPTATLDAGTQRIRNKMDAILNRLERTGSADATEF